MRIFRKLNIKIIENYYDYYTDKYLEVVESAIQSHRTVVESDMFDYYLDTMGIVDGMKLLDAGCGVCGPSVYFASKKQIEIDAINISDRQIEIAKKVIHDKKLSSKINVFKGDFHALNNYFHADSYDVVFFLESYGHSIDNLSLLNSANIVLKRNGYLYIKDYFQKELMDMRKVNKIERLMNEKHAYNLPNLNKTISILRKLNFEIVKIGKPLFKDDGGVMSAEFSRRNNLQLFKNESEMFSYADIFEVIVKKVF